MSNTPTNTNVITAGVQGAPGPRGAASTTTLSQGATTFLGASTDGDLHTYVDVVMQEPPNATYALTHQIADAQTTSAAPTIIASVPMPPGTTRARIDVTGTAGDGSASHGAILTAVFRNQSGSGFTDVAPFAALQWGTATIALTLSGIDAVLTVTGPSTTVNWGGFIDLLVRP